MSVLVSPPGLRGRDLYTKLLLRGDVLTDASASNVLGHPYARSALWLNGATQYAQVASAPDLNFANEDFTIQGWFYFASLPEYTRLYRKTPDFQIDMHYGTGITFYACACDLYWEVSACFSVFMDVNTWYFLQIKRISSYLYCVINGVQQDTAKVCGCDMSDNSGVLEINPANSSYPFYGYCCDFEVAKGIARPDAVPSSPMESDSYTSALLRVNDDGSVVDASGTGKTWSLYNSPQVITGRQITNSGVTVESALGLGFPPGFLDVLNFNGSSTLAVADSTDLRFTAADRWAIDFFVYLSNIGLPQSILSKGASSAGDVIFGFTSTGNISIGLSGATLCTTSVNLSAGIPSHCAFINDGVNLKIYKDGVLIMTIPGLAMSSTSILTVGAHSTGEYPLHGKIANLRVTKGVCRWTRGFTPSTRPY